MNVHHRLFQLPTTNPEAGRPFPLNQYKGTMSTSKTRGSLISWLTQFLGSFRFLRNNVLPLSIAIDQSRTWLGVWTQHFTGFKGSSPISCCGVSRDMYSWQTTIYSKRSYTSLIQLELVRILSISFASMEDIPRICIGVITLPKYKQLDVINKISWYISPLLIGDVP